MSPLRLEHFSMFAYSQDTSYVPKAAPRKNITGSGMPLQAKPMNKTLPPVGSYTLPKIPVATTKTTTNGYNSRFPGLLKDHGNKKVSGKFFLLVCHFVQLLFVFLCSLK